MRALQPLFDWLVRGAPGVTNPGEVVQRLCDEIVAGGLPLHRAAAYVRTLHPHIMGRSFQWRPGEPLAISQAPYSLLQSPEFLKSPAAAVFATGNSVRRRLLDTASPRDFPVLDRLASEGFTDYLAGALRFLSGQVHAVTFATREPAGFTEDHIEQLEWLLPPLARVAEIMALQRTAVNLLNTYVGRDAGERIIAGKIRRGDTDTIQAILWFSDLRGFTALANSIPPSALIGVLNDLFECQVPAIESHGGEVLKFMGDGLLAIFPIEGSSKTTAELCDAALLAATKAFSALAELNASRGSAGEPPIRFGLALHVGEVAYGNIGSRGRLDFTCIGPAVNLAARLEGLTARLDMPVVASAEFAALASTPLPAIGTFELKGVAEPQYVHAPAEGSPLRHW